MTTVCFITVPIKRYKNRLLPLLRKFLLNPKRIILWLSEWIVLLLFESILVEFVQYLVICVFSDFQLPSQPQRHSAQTKVALVYVFLYALTPWIFNSWEKWFLHLTKILWESVNKSPFLPFTILVVGLVTLLKINDTPKQVSDIFDRTVSFKYINFSCPIFLLCIPEMSTSFASSLFRLSTLLWFWFYNHCIFNLHPFIYKSWTFFIKPRLTLLQFIQT